MASAWNSRAVPHRGMKIRTFRVVADDAILTSDWPIESSSVKRLRYGDVVFAPLDGDVVDINGLRRIRVRSQCSPFCQCIRGWITLQESNGRYIMVELFEQRQDEREKLEDKLDERTREGALLKEQQGKNCEDTKNLEDKFGLRGDETYSLHEKLQGRVSKAGSMAQQETMEKLGDSGCEIESTRTQLADKKELEEGGHLRFLEMKLAEKEKTIEDLTRAVQKLQRQVEDCLHCTTQRECDCERQMRELQFPNAHMADEAHLADVAHIADGIAHIADNDGWEWISAPDFGFAESACQNGRVVASI